MASFDVFRITVVVLLLGTGYTAKVPNSGCEVEPLGDKFKITLSKEIRKTIESGCDLQLMIEDKNCGIYEKGKAPVKVLSPVLKATKDWVTLATHPDKIELDVDCLPIGQRDIKVSCTSLRSTSSSTNVSSLLTEHENPEDYQRNSTVSRHPYIAVGVIVVVVVGIGIGYIYKWRMKMRNMQNQPEYSPA